jgi:hypothetical protein
MTEPVKVWLLVDNLIEDRDAIACFTSEAAAAEALAASNPRLFDTPTIVPFVLYDRAPERVTVFWMVHRSDSTVDAEGWLEPCMPWEVMVPWPHPMGATRGLVSDVPTEDWWHMYDGAQVAVFGTDEAAVRERMASIDLTVDPVTCS